MGRIRGKEKRAARPPAEVASQKTGGRGGGLVVKVSDSPGATQ